MSSYLTQRVVGRLKEAGFDLPGDTEYWSIRRTYCGVVQKSVGAWTFVLEWAGPKDHVEAISYSGNVGSQWPASIIAKCGVGSLSPNGSIWPTEEGHNKFLENLEK